MTLKKRTISIVVALIVPFLLLGTWELLVRCNLIPPSQAASPSAVVVELISLIFSGPLLKHTAYSLGRICAGLLIGAFLGVITGVLIATFRSADRLFSPTLQLLAGVPVVVWIPFWVMFFGTDEAFKISMAAVSTFFLVHLHTFGGVRSVGKPYLELADIYEKTLWKKIRHIILPAATPSIITAIRTSLAFCWVVIFFVEYASAAHGSEGLGWFIADARQVGKIEEEFAGLFFLGLIAFFCDRILSLFQRRTLLWADTLETKLTNEN